MKRWVLAVGFVAVFMGVIAWAMLATEKKPPSSDPKPESSPVVQDPAPGEPVLTKGAYKEYSEEAVAATEGTRLLFFHASWCPQCRQLDASLRQSEIPSGVTIFKVDYDSNQALRQKYGVTIQTTVVKIDAQGDGVEKYVAYDEPTFAAVKENLLP